MSGFRIDAGGKRDATARDRVGIFLFHDYAVFDGFSRGGRRLAADRTRRRDHGLPLGRASAQRKTCCCDRNFDQAGHERGFPHALVFSLPEPLVDGNLDYMGTKTLSVRSGESDDKDPGSGLPTKRLLRR